MRNCSIIRHGWIPVLLVLVALAAVTCPPAIGAPVRTSAAHFGCAAGSVQVSPVGGFEVSFAATTGNLDTVDPTGCSGDWHLAMKAGTSPSITILSGGGYQIAFQANTGNLWTVGPAGTGDWGLGMKAGTSPSMPGGGYQIAVQANTGNLYTVGSAGWGDWPLPMLPATSPDLTAPALRSGFQSSISAIGPDLAARMRTSWRVGCPVGLADLRYLTVSYRGFDGIDHQGELVVAATVAPAVVGVFQELFDDGFPIDSLRLVDDFGGSDDRSMAANNSSAFNCRPVTGGSGFSEHSYGTAIDLNPVQNPYVTGALVLPEQGRAFLGRTPAPGVILPGDGVVSAFAGIGWTWGGSWRDPSDYQHFSLTGH